MKFSTREDIAAPIERVFRSLSDFPGFERAALRRGVEMRRRQELVNPGAEMGWDVEFYYRGRRREVSAELVHYDPPNTMRYASVAKGLTGDGVIELVALSRGRTRLLLSLELRPTSIGGRLVLQSLKLAKNRLNRRFRQRAAAFAADLEAGYGRRGEKD